MACVLTFACVWSILTLSQVKWNKPYLSNLPASYNHGKKITLTNFKEAAFISIKTSKLELRKLYMYIVISLIEISLIDVQTLPYLHRQTT